METRRYRLARMDGLILALTIFLIVLTVGLLIAPLLAFPLAASGPMDRLDFGLGLARLRFWR